MIDAPDQQPALTHSLTEQPEIRAVLDANVVASALVNPLGPPGQIVTRLLEASAFESIVSEKTLAELRRIVAYPRLRPYIRLEDTTLAQWIEHFAIISTVVEDEPFANAPVVQSDPDDDLYLAVATTGRAMYIVSGDRHLLDLESYATIGILTPRQFLQLLDVSTGSVL